jgi:hypothetical protein
MLVLYPSSSSDKGVSAWGSRKSTSMSLPYNTSNFSSSLFLLIASIGPDFVVNPSLWSISSYGRSLYIQVDVDASLVSRVCD